jgi:hypothetical protein
MLPWSDMQVDLPFLSNDLPFLSHRCVNLVGVPGETQLFAEIKCHKSRWSELAFVWSAMSENENARALASCHSQWPGTCVLIGPAKQAFVSG